MKVCCSTGEPYDNLTFYEKLGLCCGDHCVRPMEIEDFDLLLTGLGTFNTTDCTSSDDLCKLLDKQLTDNPTDWKQWITSQIEQEGIEKYKEWYGRMLQREAICEELMKANDEMFKGEKE